MGGSGGRGVVISSSSSRFRSAFMVSRSRSPCLQFLRALYSVHHEVMYPYVFNLDVFLYDVILLNDDRG